MSINLKKTNNTHNAEQVFKNVVALCNTIRLSHWLRYRQHGNPL